MEKGKSLPSRQVFLLSQVVSGELSQRGEGRRLNPLWSRSFDGEGEAPSLRSRLRP